MGRVEEELALMLSRLGEGALVTTRSGDILTRIVMQPFTVAGKRIRPALVLLAARAAGGRAQETSMVSLAAAVELLHAASLVHDDVIDGADSRRRQASLNRLFGNSVAVLAGDLLYTGFFSRLLGLSAVPLETRAVILEVFLSTTNAMCMGEILAQGTSSHGNPLSLEEYLEIATDKTAALFSACCRCAAILRGADERVVSVLAEFGLRFGLLFQITDDMIDGDVLLEPSVDLARLACESADAARRSAASLGAGASGDTLLALVDYVARRAG
jgi:octaprenyl-diphosphate synthase